MKIATWNVNSIKARMHAVTQWLEEAQPDVACLQEIKTVDESFPSVASMAPSASPQFICPMEILFLMTQ